METSWDRQVVEVGVLQNWYWHKIWKIFFFSFFIMENFKHTQKVKGVV